MTNKPHVLDMTATHWRQWIQEHADVGARPFLERQITRWVLGRRIYDPLSMSDVPAKLRTLLSEQFRWLPEDLSLIHI